MLRFKPLLKKILIILFLLSLLDAVGVIVYWNYSKSFVSPGMNIKFDCGIVFFHSINKTGGLSDESMRRCILSINLFRDKKVKYLICSGGAKISVNNIGSKLMKEYILSFDIPDSLILLDTLSFSTKTNIIESYKIMNEKGLSSAVLVSSPTHILRIKYLSDNFPFNKEFKTFRYNYSLLDIFIDCNSEFAKWIALLFLPESFTEFARSIINN